MPESLRSLRIFISSPGDVSTERRIAETVIHDVNNICKDVLEIHVQADAWEHLSPITENTPEKTIQQKINEQIKRCNAFVLILSKRYGQKELGEKKSNVEREIDVALKMQAEGREMTFLSYFKRLEPNPDQGRQEEQVRQLREKLEKQGIFYYVFTDEADFRNRFTHDLYNSILRSIVLRSKQQALRCFWQLGNPEGSVHPQLAILYPPVDRRFMPKETPDQWWLRRLVPYVVFEDFKAIQKIEKTLRIVGFRDFQSYNILNAPDDLQDLNRMWICLPRNAPAQHQLAEYRKQVKFAFVPFRNQLSIHWHPGGPNSKPITVESPLSKYLYEQRHDIPGGEWRPAHGRIIAKDYAILARFSDKRGRVPMSSGTLKDYFLAGIRGLGTWGAGWFLDRRYRAFERPCEKEDADVQFLLEVTYLNENILDVRDVSREPRSYFSDENNLRTIKTRIREST